MFSIHLQISSGKADNQILRTISKMALLSLKLLCMLGDLESGSVITVDVH